MDLNLIEFYDDLKEGSKKLLKQHALKETFEAGTLLRENHSNLCEYLCLIVKGEIRAYKRNAEGKSVMLYEVKNNDLCLKNLQCVLYEKTYDALAITQTKSLVYMIPKRIVKDHLMKDCAFQGFINKVLLSKMDTLVNHYEAINFAPVKKRLMLYIKEMSLQFTRFIIYTTHQKIADEINASREEVSRSLKMLEKEKLIELSRGKIKILKPFSVM